MKEYLRLGAILAIITSIAGLLLGFAHSMTKDAIAASGNVSKDDLAIVMPASDNIKASLYEGKEDEAIQEVIPAYKSDELAGYVIKVSSKGFHGEILTLVGISTEGKVTGAKVLSHSETPGVGSKIEKPDFFNRFKNKSAASDIKVVKTSTSKEDEIQGISGASISSRAVTSAVNEAIKYYNSKLKGGQ